MYGSEVNTDASDDLAPRPCRVRDLAALIGLLAVTEGEIMAGEIPPHLTGRIRDRLERETLLEPHSTERDLRQAINDLNHRVRYALGEYDEQPPSLPVPE
jgi:hypothetical protein